MWGFGPGLEFSLGVKISLGLHAKLETKKAQAMLGEGLQKTRSSNGFSVES